MYVTRYIITIIMQVTTRDLKWKILLHRSLMTFSRNLHLRYQSMQEIEMPRKCCFSPLEEELGRGALIKQKFNYLLSIRNFRREKCIGLDSGRRGKPIMITFAPKHTLKVLDLSIIVKLRSRSRRPREGRESGYGQEVQS